MLILSLFRWLPRLRFLDWFSLSSTLDDDFVQEYLTSRGTHTLLNHDVVRHISYLALLRLISLRRMREHRRLSYFEAPRAVDSTAHDCFSVSIRVIFTQTDDRLQENRFVFCLCCWWMCRLHPMEWLWTHLG